MVLWNENGFASPGAEAKTEGREPRPAVPAPPVQPQATATCESGPTSKATPPLQTTTERPRPPTPRRRQQEPGDPGCWEGFAAGLERNLDALADGKPIKVLQPVLEEHMEPGPRGR